MLERYSEEGHFREGSVHAMRMMERTSETNDFCHRNMPNIRIAPGVFAGPHNLLIEDALNGLAGSATVIRR
jgi:hypothetical protein